MRQGELVSNLVQFAIDLPTLGQEEIALDSQTHPLAIVVSQDCDLMWDHEERRKPDPSGYKLLPNILFCEVITAADLRGRNRLDSDIWKRVVQNKDERYHFLRSVDPVDDAGREGIADLAIDFKRYFTIKTDEVYAQLAIEARRRARLISPYLEHLCDRFAYFQQRVALPEDHFIAPARPRGHEA